jgi:ribosome-associated protein
VTIDTNQILRVAIKALEQMKATDVTVLDVKGISTFTDYFVLASAVSQTQLRAIRREVDRLLSAAGEEPLGVDGVESATWIVLDLGDVVVHVFEPHTRSVYNLESLWGDAEALDTAQILTA